MTLLPYRPCVGVVLLNCRGLVFLGKRRARSPRETIDPEHAWQLPQGGIDAGESPVAAARRELREETGVAQASYVAECPDWLAYDFPAGASALAFGGRYRGQRQKWFAFRFEGKDEDIDLVHTAVGGEPEFSSWRWERLAKIPDLVVPFKRNVYRQVAAAFARFAA